MFATHILQLYGYKSEGCQDILKIQEPISLDTIVTTTFELFLVTIELKVMLEIAREIELYTDSITLDDVLEARTHTTGDVEEAKRLLIKVKSIPTERKRIKLDATELQRERENSKDSTKDEHFTNVRSRSFTQEFPERQTLYQSHNTSRGGKAASTKVTHISSINGVEILTKTGRSGMYYSVDKLSDAELYGVSATPTYVHHYPQNMDTTGESDYVSMSANNDDDCYETMAPQPNPRIPPPTYHEAIHHQFPENVMEEYVVISSPSKHLDHDAASAIPGISGLNIRENGPGYSEKRGKIENGILPEFKSQKHRKKEKGSVEQIAMDELAFSTSSNRAKAPSAVTTSVTYKSSSLNGGKVAGQGISSAKVTNSNDKIKSQSRVSGESYVKSSRNEPHPESRYIPSSSKTSDQLSSYKTKDQLGSNIMYPPAAKTKTEPQKSLHVSDDKQKTAYKEQQEYLSRRESQKRYCAMCPKEATHVCTNCNKVCCKDCRSAFSTLPCEGASIHRLVERNESVCTKEKMIKDENCVNCGKLSDYECYSCKVKHENNGTSQEFPYPGHRDFKLSTPNGKEQYREDNSNSKGNHQNENCCYCGKDSTHECNICKKKSCTVCHHIKALTDPCKSTMGHVFKLLASDSLAQFTELSKDLDNSNICEFCGLVATFICADCHNRICKQCQHIYNKEHCPATKKDHFFQLITSHTKIEPKEEPWSCGRCTFSNPPQNKICAICATSRGVTSVEFPESGSRKCAQCTYGNTEDAKICVICGCTLPPSQLESYI